VGCFAAATVLLVASVGDAPAYQPPPPSPVTASRPVLAPRAGVQPTPTATRALPAARALPRSEPTTLTIGRIGVRTALIGLGLRRDGTPDVPPLGARSPAGWIEALATPGEIGPAVILGHVDSAQEGPAVFYRLGELRPGDLVTVDRADRRRVRFVVTSVEQVAKSAFPAATIYGPVDYPALRLITCGGSFDPARGHYRDNVIVFAAATRATG
jgi:hypothetical protein